MEARTKILAIVIAAIVVISGIAVAMALNKDVDDTVTVGVMWRTNPSSETYVYTCKAVEESGAKLVRIGQVFSYDLSYDDNGKLMEGISEIGFLDSDAASLVKKGNWRNSNVESALSGVDYVIFPGGDDISPTLYANPQEWVDSGEDRSFEPERDVSDYLAMTYCLEKDIPIIGICRGMQMLAVVSGAEMIQDIPTYYEEQSLTYHYEHRNQKTSPDAYRDFASHDVVVFKDSQLYKIMGEELLTGCPSWHHQAVRSVEGTNLIVTAITPTDGIDIIEGLERTDKRCAFGIQYHPEAVLIKKEKDPQHLDDYMSYDEAMKLFRWIADRGRSVQSTEYRESLHQPSLLPSGIK